MVKKPVMSHDDIRGKEGANAEQRKKEESEISCVHEQKKLRKPEQTNADMNALS